MATTRSGILGMGHIEATSLAYERSVQPTNPASAREHPNIYHSITNRCLALVRGQDPARVPPASPALARAGRTGRCFRECLIARCRRAGRVHRCERWRPPKNLNLACTWQPITVQNGPIQAGSPGVASQLSRTCLLTFCYPYVELQLWEAANHV